MLPVEMCISQSSIGVTSSVTVEPSIYDEAVLKPDVDELNDSDEATVDCD